MLVRHCVEESNVDENLIVKDPTKIRHGIVLAGRLQSMSGLIDPASHLNLDYPDHKITNCVIVEKFENGAKVRLGDRGLIFAIVDRSSFDHYGFVDYTQRLSDMIKEVKKIRESRLTTTTKKISRKKDRN
ncbi:MAG TPA: hypothetical protein VKA95_18145 [Nitrososphaeraceae archaeon]|jgi:hypothetical protein|nr:hypothetical protein [Nitrososphaeraceae archaeon]